MTLQTLSADSSRFRQLLDVTRKLFLEHPWALAFIVLGDAVVAFLQVIALASLYPVLEQVLQSRSIAVPQAGYFAALLERMGWQASVGNLALLFLTMTVVASAAYLCVMTFQSAFVRDLERSVRTGLVRSVLSAGWPVLGRLNHGEFVNVVTHEAELYKVLLRNVLSIIAAVFQVTLFAAAIVYLNGAFGVAAAVALLLGYAALAPLMQQGMRLGKRYTQAFGRMTSALINTGRAFKNIKTSSREAYVEAYLAPILAAPGEVYRSQQMLEAGRLKLFEFVGSGIMLGLLLFGLEVIQVPVAEMLLMLVFLYRMVPKVSETADYVHRAYASLPSLAQVQEIQDRCAPEPGRTVTLSEPVTAITFKDVGFRHGDLTVLLDMNVTIRRGEFWAIAGPTGAGKTTILDLISGIVEPTEGEIYLDGQALGQVSRSSLHARVGYLTQDTMIFAGSILENVLWGHEKGSRSRLDAAIDIAQLRDVIIEKTLEHDVSEAGQNLSGGQKQRIAIARLLMGDYDFVLMDEPTSALDADTEIRFIRALSLLKGKVALVMVTHREEYIRECDHVLRLEHGRAVVESGA